MGRDQDVGEHDGVLVEAYSDADYEAAKADPIGQIEGEDASGQAKHIDVRFKFVKNFAKKKVLEVLYCESKSMRADILTKTLPAPRLDDLRDLVMISRQG
ncbi:Copia protein [Phytophthora megakarya]|uniref:Copia protein n=1 Tax=Phytophthora megakarya TaxID=4795 RepID=A0A225UC58_9STRA|nr:Copia protein [Phytophthora megakarya]